MSVWALISLWLTGYGYLPPPHSENRSYAFALKRVQLQTMRVSVTVQLSKKSSYYLCDNQPFHLFSINIEIFNHSFLFIQS